MATRRMPPIAPLRIELIKENGFGVLYLNNRGYGGSGGRPTEEENRRRRDRGLRLPDSGSECLQPVLSLTASCWVPQTGAAVLLEPTGWEARCEREYPRWSGCGTAHRKAAARLVSVPLFCHCNVIVAADV